HSILIPHGSKGSHGLLQGRVPGKVLRKRPRPVPPQNSPAPCLPRLSGCLPRFVSLFHYVYQYRDEIPSAPPDKKECRVLPHSCLILRFCFFLGSSIFFYHRIIH